MGSPHGFCCSPENFRVFDLPWQAPAVIAAVDIERLSLRDLPDNVGLSRSVGWKDVDAEWRTLHAAATVRGARQDGRLIAQGALGDCGTAMTLAKMVVATEHRGRGLGSRLLDGFLADAEARALPVGLCATDLGRPLYESRGFVESGRLMILFGTAASVAAPEGDAVMPLADERALLLDRALSGCDRSAMVRARLAEASVRVALARESSGYALATPHGDHTLVGPILAESFEGACLLLSAVLSAISGPLRIDVPLDQQDFRRRLVELGLREVSERAEMARGARRMPWQVPERFALSTQAWG